MIKSPGYKEETETESYEGNDKHEKELAAWHFLLSDLMVFDSEGVQFMRVALQLSH